MAQASDSLAPSPLAEEGWDNAMNTMPYEGHTAKIEFDGRDSIIVGLFVQETLINSKITTRAQPN